MEIVRRIPYLLPIAQLVGALAPGFLVALHARAQVRRVGVSPLHGAVEHVAKQGTLAVGS